MRFTLAFVALSALSASATLLGRQSIPSCAEPCLTNAPTGSCGENDSCLCTDQAFITNVTTCIQQDCTGSDLTSAEAAAQALCAAVGVTLTASGATSSGSSPSSSSAPAATSSTSGAMAHYGAPALAGLAAVGAIALGL